MLDDALKSQLAGYLQRLDAPLVLSAALDATDASREMQALLDDLAALSPKIALDFPDAATLAPGTRRPSFSVARAGDAPRIRFSGVPLGHEFTSLVLALLHTGGHPPKLDAATRDAVRALSGPHHFETYVSLTCQNCPEVVQSLNILAALNPGVTHEMIDGALFPDEVAARQILAVPNVFRNGEPFVQGRTSVEELVAKLDEAGARRAAADLGERAPYDMLVVGGGPAGAAAAIYAARKGIRTGLVTERLGGQVLDTVGIENFISVTYTEGPQLAAALAEHVRAYDIDLVTAQRAAELTPAAPGGLHALRLESGPTLRARSVILAPGARWREIGVPGEAEYRTRGVTFCPHCDGPFFKGKRVAVIGGGNSGVEAAIDLAGVVAHVTLLEFDALLRADGVLQTRLRSLPNVRVITSAQTTEVTGDGQKVNGLVYKDGETGETHRVDLEGIFVQIGLLPSTEWLRGGPVALSRRGEIEVDARGQTSVPGIFAAGDATTVPFKQIVVALGEGAKASLAAFEWMVREGVAVGQKSVEG